jgi:dTDP-4-amino-4,6-dideoxygalactose transaminase
MPVPLLDLSVLWERHRHATEAAIQRVLESQAFILGPEVAAFEEEMTAWLEEDVACVGVANGSDALVLAMMALGVGPDDEVICPAFTFVSTATSVSLLGARPVFVDVEPSTFNLDVERTIEAVTERTRAVIAVHLFGRPADVVRLRARLDALGREDIPIIEDAAQSLGARLDGRRACALTPIACTSFFPAKNLGCFGDGGMVMTKDPVLAESLRMLRQHGSRTKYFNEVIGCNSRLDALQAAILRTKLPLLDGWCDERRTNADFYRAHLHERGLDVYFALPDGDGDDGRYHHIYNQFTLRTPLRDALAAWLGERGIGCAVYYPRPLHEQPCYADLARQTAPCPVSEMLSRTVLSLPVFPGLTETQATEVVEALASFAAAHPDGAMSR